MTSPTIVKGTYPPDTGLRIGVAQVSSTGEVTVTVSGKTVSCGYIDPRGFITNEPVALLRGESSWLALGRSLSQPMAAEGGQESISFTTQTSFTQAVTFDRVFPSTPHVFTNITSGAGSTAGWGSRAITVTQSGFTIFVFGTVSTWAGVPVDWFATT